MYISRISKSGTIVWQKNLHYFLKETDTAVDSLYIKTFYPHNIWQLKTLKDNNLAIIGSTVIEGFMLKITPEGEPIWYRKYYPLQLPPLAISEYSYNGIVGIVETSDNGFLFNGWSHYQGYTVPIWGRKSAFIYKADEYGCIVEGCYKQDKWYKDSVQMVEDSLQVIQDSIADAKNKSNRGNSILVYPNSR